MSMSTPTKPLRDKRIEEVWNKRLVVTRGIAHEPFNLPGFVALKNGIPVGVATYFVRESEMELVTLDAFAQWQGIGTSLIEAVEEEARKSSCSRLWMVTTNDNVDALRFYQVRGYVISAVHCNAVDESRKLKPNIPFNGNYGIPIRDEIELEKYLWCWIGW
jgi:GNAT superfamily N-acetyltransferase